MSGGFVVCRTPGQFLVPGLTSIAGELAGGMIQTDWHAHLGRTGVFPLSKKDFADFTAGFANMTLYTAFLKANNPQLSVSQLLKMRVKGIRKIPDFCTHDSPKRLDFYEVKPDSRDGRADGEQKIAEIDAPGSSTLGRLRYVHIDH